jgi:transcriptional regulator with XRE-family HTH domain
MTVMMKGKRGQLAAHRRAMSFTQEAFAERLGVDVSTVRRWESGRSEPQPWQREKIARALQVSPGRLDELLADGLTARSTGTGRLLMPSGGDGIRLHLQPEDEHGGRLLRELAACEADLSVARVITLHTGITGLASADPIAGTVPRQRGKPGSGVLRHLRDRLEAGKAKDGICGQAAALPAVLDILAFVNEVARTAGPEIRGQFLTLAADCAEFAGWLYRDAMNLECSMYWHDRAMEWAQESGDLPRQGYVLLKKAQLAYDYREPARMLALSRSVQDGPWSLPAQVQAEAAQQVARALAMLGAPLDDVERELGHAWDLLDAAAGSQTAIGAHYSTAVLSMQTAACYAEVGQPGRAIELYRQNLSPETFSPRDFGYFQSWMAASLAMAGYPESSARIVRASAERAVQLGSNRTRSELRRVHALLQPWRNRPSVRELQAAVK